MAWRRATRMYACRSPALLHVLSAGVIWLGDKVIEGVPETLDMLRSLVRPITRCMHAMDACGRARLILHVLDECPAWARLHVSTARMGRHMRGA